jgi:large subunit ribosomal protein L16
MLFIPTRQKYKKQQKGKAFNKITNSKSILTYGQIGLKVLSSYRLNSKQLLALYNGLKKKIKRKGKLIINVFPQTPISKKPIEVRMGKGKGNVSYWVSKIKSGVILCEISTPYIVFAKKVLNHARFKLPIKTKIVSLN